MQIQFLKQRTTLVFALFTSFIFGGFLTAELINDRFWLNDFKVFYLAAKALLNNEQVYGVAFGLDTGFYKYSPVTLFFFIPFQLLSFKVAALVQYSIISISSIAAILLLRQMINKFYLESKVQNLFPLLAVFLGILVLLGRELHLGNINMILLMLVIFASKLLFENKSLAAGAIIALVILTKPYFVICFIPLLLFKQYKVIVGGIIAGAVFISLSFFVFGYEKMVGLFTGWLQSLFLHSSTWYGRWDLLGILNRSFGLEIPPSINIYYFFGLSIVLSMLMRFLFKRNQIREINATIEKSWMVMSIFILIALAPSSLGTDSEHFLFSLPILIFLVFQLSVNPRPAYVVFFAILVFLFAANSRDIIGKDLSLKYDEYGVLGIVNLIFVGILIYLFTAKRKIWKA